MTEKEIDKASELLLDHITRFDVKHDEGEMYLRVEWCDGSGYRTFYALDEVFSYLMEH